MDVAKIRRFAAAILIATGTLAAPVLADQTDRRLDGLFAELKTADSPESAQTIEAQIWSIWVDSGNAQTNDLMQAGIAALAAQDGEQALAAFDKMVQTAPNFAEGWNKRATALYLLGRYTDSIADIDRVLALEPRHFGALSGLGLCNAQLDRLRAAVDAFERALAVDPTMPGVRANLHNLKQLLAKQSI